MEGVICEDIYLRDYADGMETWARLHQCFVFTIRNVATRFWPIGHRPM